MKRIIYASPLSFSCVQKHLTKFLEHFQCPCRLVQTFRTKNMKHTYTSRTYYLFTLELEQQTTTLLKHQTNLENTK